MSDENAVFCVPLFNCCNCLYCALCIFFLSRKYASIITRKTAPIKITKYNKNRFDIKVRTPLSYYSFVYFSLFPLVDFTVSDGLSSDDTFIPQ